ncbi:MAG: transcriptional repressor LexA [Verrucomicrobia bacterium]|nr:transcriptional repressor LexA [Verrucomicrobiota bacterium]MCF7709449.1 transcriptional repressor LexA [Verrucomicrobiota bacterium]
MKAITERQKRVLEFIRDYRERHGGSPSLREIAAHFGFRSMTAAADHVRALRNKGALQWVPRRARSLYPGDSMETPDKALMEIPVYGGIPAGFTDERRQEELECIAVDPNSLGIRATSRTFALEVRGDSMIGRHILDGDYVILEHGMMPRPGDVVAALIDNESTLKTYHERRGRPYLKAENPEYPDFIPASELVIQGVMVALIRRRKG